MGNSRNNSLSFQGFFLGGGVNLSSTMKSHTLVLHSCLVCQAVYVMYPLSLCSCLGGQTGCGSTTALGFAEAPKQHSRDSGHSGVPKRGSETGKFLISRETIIC